MESQPIGVFDSGVGGLSILAHIHRLLPEENVLYFADQAHVPYGPRSMMQVRDFSKSITRYLLSKGAKIIVLACNTASAAALHHLRKTFPEVPFVGMEPAVKPAASTSKSQMVGVLATPATFQGELYGSVVERFAGGIKLKKRTLRGLVERIEANDLSGPETRKILQQKITPLIEHGVDTLVLACTHYAFVIPTIEEIFGPSLKVIDPSPAIGQQTKRLLEQRGLLTERNDRGMVTYISTTDARKLSSTAERLIDLPGKPLGVDWADLDIQE